MAGSTLKITFSLDEDDLAYYRRLFRQARHGAEGIGADRISRGARKLVESVRRAKKTPSFVKEAADELEALIEMVEDEEWALPRSVASQVLAALAYFANPKDLVPDHLPGLGFLDDAIMIRIMSEQFKHELWAYKRFCAFRNGMEQRPWTGVARERRAPRLAEKRRELRAKIAERKAREAARSRRRLVW